MRILHVEDSPRDVALVSGVLHAAGFSCETVHVDTAENLAAELARGDVDLVLSDFTMPGFDGLSALRMVREADPVLPFIFVSGTMGEDAAVETLRAGATDYVLKDRLTRLEACVRRALAEAAERRRVREAQQHLAEQAEILTLVSRATRDAIWDWDLKIDRLVWRSDDPTSLFGYTVQELGESARGWRERIHRDDRDRVLASVHRVIHSSESSWLDEYRFERRDGGYAHVLHRAYLIRDTAGLPTRLIGAVTNITERVELEAQLRHAQKMEAVGTLAGSIAHDFNNVLMSIFAFTELARDGLPVGHPSRDDIDEVWKAAERAATLTRQLLAFSRKQVVEPTVLDLAEVVSDLERMLTRLLGRDITIDVTAEAGLLRVRADRGQVEQVLMNLALNARDAMPDGGRLTITLYNDGGPPDRGRDVVVVVGDTGVGMDEATRARIFEPFFTTKAPGRGTGLGLSTVHGIVEEWGGRVDVASEVGRGTTFTVRLPGLGPEAHEPGATEPAPHARAATVLVVEDDPGLRRLVSRVLRQHGYTVLDAASAEHARGILAREGERVDLLLADAILPQSSGLDLIREAWGERPALRAILMSGHAGLAAEDNVVLENRTFLQKPFSTKALLATLRQVLDGRDT